MKVLVVAEYYPRANDPVLGIWAHRQAIAARDAGAELRVLVLHRPAPSLAAVRAGDYRAFGQALRQPARAELDGLRVAYLRYLSPPRPWSYDSWGAWAAPALRLALRRLRRSFPFDLIHAHYAVPAGDAVRRAAPQIPLIVSVHGHDVHGSGPRSTAVRRTLAHSVLVLANSTGTARRCAGQGARATRVVHLGADLPSPASPTPETPGAPTLTIETPGTTGTLETRTQTSETPGTTGTLRTPVGPGIPTLVSVGHLVARKRHADVLRALALLRERHPDLRYVIVGDGPERQRLGALAASLGVADMLELRGQLPHAAAVAAARSASLFVLPSVEEAFGVAYIEAMAGEVPAIGCRGEDGPEEIAAAGGGIALVAPRDPHGLARRIDALLADPGALAQMGREARITVQRRFAWEHCGRQTVQAYRDVLSH